MTEVVDVWSAWGANAREGCQIEDEPSWAGHAGLHLGVPDGWGGTLDAVV